MRVRIKEPAVEVPRLVRFLVINDYPHNWYPDDLAKCVILAIENSAKETVGYVWIHGDLNKPGELELHVCITKAWRGRVATPRVVQPILALCELMGAKALRARCPTPKVAKAMEKIGFKPNGEFSVFIFDQ